MEHYQTALQRVLGDPDRFAMELTDTEQKEKLDKRLSDDAVAAWEAAERPKMVNLDSTKFSKEARTWAYVSGLIALHFCGGAYFKCIEAQ